MNIVWGFVIIIAVTAVAVAAMLFVRRTAPEGGYFEDGDRASGVFGVLATGFSVLLGFIIFLAFESYDQSRSGAEQEALVVAQQVENAQFFPGGCRAADRRARLLRALGRQRRVGADAEGTQGDAINPWGVRMFRDPADRRSRRRRWSSPPTTSGSIRHRRGRRRGATASTAPSA